MDRVHGHFFLINENWTKTEIEQNKIWQDAVHKYLVVLIRTLLAHVQSTKKETVKAKALPYKDSHYEQAEV